MVWRNQTLFCNTWGKISKKETKDCAVVKSVSLIHTYMKFQIYVCLCFTCVCAGKRWGSTYMVFYTKNNVPYVNIKYKYGIKFRDLSIHLVESPSVNSLWTFQYRGCLATAWICPMKMTSISFRDSLSDFCLWQVVSLQKKYISVFLRDPMLCFVIFWPPISAFRKSYAFCLDLYTHSSY